MMNQQPKDITYKKIAWTIGNFKTLKTNTRHYSEVFTISNCNWKVFVCRGEKGGKYLAIYLNAADASSLPQGWSIDADLTFTVVNQSFRKKSVENEVTSTFSAEGVSFGRSEFMSLKLLENPSEGFIFNDKCIVEVEFHVVKPVGVDDSGDDKVHFKDLGRIEKPFVPLLEEVFSQNPSLLDCKNNRSREFTQWAFNSLGRVLQFLVQKKWKDMKDEKACKELRRLWEELEMTRLNVTWLEPVVMSALKMKGYDEKADKVKKLKQNLEALATQMKELKVKVGDSEQTLKMIRKDSENAMEGFEEKDLDAKIGYGKP